MKNKKGFTLIELLAVIIILGILLFIGIPAISSLINSSKIKTYKDNAKLFLNNAKNIYILDDLNNDGKIYTLNDIDVSKNEKSPYGGKYDFEKSFIYVDSEKSCIQLVDENDNYLYPPSIPDEMPTVSPLNTCFTSDSIDKANIKKMDNIRDSKMNDFFGNAEIVAININNDGVSSESYGMIDIETKNKYKPDFNIGDNVFLKVAPSISFNSTEICKPYTVFEQNSKNSVILFPRIILDEQSCNAINKGGALSFYTSPREGRKFVKAYSYYKNYENNYINNNANLSTLSIEQINKYLKELVKTDVTDKEVSKLFKSLVYPIESCDNNGNIDFNNYSKSNVAYWISDNIQCSYGIIDPDAKYDPNTTNMFGMTPIQLEKSYCSVAYWDKDDNFTLKLNEVYNQDSSYADSETEYKMAMILPMVLYADEADDSISLPLYKDQNCTNQYTFNK